MTQALRARDLKPYAPAHVTATRGRHAGTRSPCPGRRTRIGGDWRDGTGTVPLAEAAEAYEVDMLDAAGDVVRVLESATPQVLYAAATRRPISAGAGHAHPVASIQISAAVGRGFPAPATVQET